MFLTALRVLTGGYAAVRWDNLSRLKFLAGYACVSPFPIFEFSAAPCSCSVFFADLSRPSLVVGEVYSRWHVWAADLLMPLSHTSRSYVVSLCAAPTTIADDAVKKTPAVKSWPALGESVKVCPRPRSCSHPLLHSRNCLYIVLTNVTIPFDIHRTLSRRQLRRWPRAVPQSQRKSLLRGRQGRKTSMPPSTIECVVPGFSTLTRSSCLGRWVPFEEELPLHSRRNEGKLMSRVPRPRFSWSLLRLICLWDHILI